jgi:hypothetical protein
VGSRASATHALAVGSSANATADNATALGNGAIASAQGAVAVGAALASGEQAIAIGTGAIATGSVAVGAEAFAANGGAAFGDNAVASGLRATASGNRAAATGEFAGAFGANTLATHTGSYAFGSDAFGRGAQTYYDNQMVFGTSSHTYTAPGISSYLSKMRQVGQINVATTDAYGNLADDGGAIFRRLDGQEGGIAMAIAMENPTLAPNETFGVSTALGSYSGANAISASAMGEIKKNVFLRGDRVTMFGGIGASFDNGRSGSTYGGRIGVQWSH